MATKKGKKSRPSQATVNARGARAVAAAAEKAGKGKKAKGLATVGELASEHAKKRGQKVPAAAAAADYVILGKPYVEKLPVPVDAADPVLRVKADELAGVILERLDVKDARRDAMDRFKKQLAHLDEQERDLALEVKQKVRLVEIKVEKRLLRGTRRLQLVRLDTGKVIGERDATEKDLKLAQEGLPKVDDAPRARAAKGKTGTLLDPSTEPRKEPTQPSLALDALPSTALATVGEDVDATIASLEEQSLGLAVPLGDEGEGIGHEPEHAIDDDGAEHVSEPH